MPRRNPKKDSITIYYAYRLGFNEENKPVFGAVKSCEAYFSDRSGEFDYAQFGSDNKFGTHLILQDTEATRYFDKYTKIWVFSTPTSSNQQADYLIKSEPEIRDGQIMLDCDSLAVDNRQLYYLYNDEIIRFTAIFNESASVFYTPLNQYLPIDKTTVMWYNEPDDAEEAATMTFVSKRIRAKFIEYTVRLVEEEDENEDPVEPEPEEPEENDGE